MSKRLVLAKHLFTGLLSELRTKIESSVTLVGNFIHGESLDSIIALGLDDDLIVFIKAEVRFD